MPIKLLNRNGHVCLHKFFAAVLLGLLLHALPGTAAVVHLNQDSGEINLASRFDMWEDPDGRVTVQQMLDNSGAFRFTPLNGNLSAGYSNSVFWLRLQIQRDSPDSPEHWLLEMTPVMLDDIRLFESQSDGSWREHRAGDHLQLDQQEFRHHYPLFEIQPKDQAVHTLYFRIQTSSSVFFRARLMNSRLFIERSNQLSVLMGMFQGIMLAMIVYNLVLLPGLRDWSQAHYLLMSASMLLTGLSANGYIGLWLAPGQPWLVDLAPALSAQMVVLTASLFVTSFLGLKERMPRVYRLFRLIQALVLLILLLILAGQNHRVAAFGQYLAVLQIVLMLPVSLIIAKRGFMPAYLVGAAVLIWFGGVLLIPLRNLGLIQASSLTDYGYQVGSAIEVILLALAQAYRIHLVKQDSARVQQQLLEVSHRAEQELEMKIAMRTRELDLAVERLKKLDQEKNEFLGIAAHDLKNPLSSMIGMSELLRKCYHEIPVSQQLNYLQRISRNGERMMHIVKNLLDVNALESGHLQLQCRPLNLSQAVFDASHLYEQSLAAKQLRLAQSIPPDVMVLADPDALLQILDNLISNAIKYSPAGKLIRLSVDSDARCASFTVTDQGPGLCSADQARLFEKFTRLSTTPTAGEHSSGLGLSIVKKLCEAQGGKVSCASQPGQGASFCVSLPLASAQRTAEGSNSNYNAEV